MVPFCNLCFVFVFVILSCLSLAACWERADLLALFKSLVCDVFLFFFSLSHMVSWVRCGI